MREHIVLTGATGAIGVPLTGRLLCRPSLERLTVIVRATNDASNLPAILNRISPGSDITKLRVVIGDVTYGGLGLTPRIKGPPITSVIHGAAFTRFRDSESQWEEVNVKGTCPYARLIYLSTAVRCRQVHWTDS